MEQHPVPQNVTNFQFRLVGDMTIKQFGYLASGFILGYICYKLPLPFFFTWPLGLTALLGGIGLAFVPVQERPMDIWITSFLKNTYSPTQYIWQKVAATPQTIPVVQPAKKSFLSMVLPTQPVAALSKKSSEPTVAIPTPTSVGEMVGRFFKPKAPPEPATGTTKTPIDFTQVTQKPPSITGKHIDVQAELKPQAPSPKEGSLQNEKIENLEKMIVSMQKELAERMANEKRFGELQQELAAALAQKEQVDRELALLRQQLAHPRPSQVTRPAGFVTVNPAKGPTVRVIAPESAVRAGLPRLTTLPNVVSGIVKDQNGNLLPGVLVTVRDKDDVPLRALKTNKLGQFAASTPLPNGTYLIEVEDPRGTFTFDRAQATLVGAVLPPIEIAAKSQKQINRDKLARELFGDQIK